MHLNPLTPRAQLLGELQQLLASNHICSVVLDASSPLTEHCRTLVIPENAILILCPIMELCIQACWLLQRFPPGDGNSARSGTVWNFESPGQQREEEGEEAPSPGWPGCMLYAMARFYVRGQEVKVFVLQVV